MDEQRTDAGEDEIGFLAARLDEEEAAAKAATPGPWTVGPARTAEADELAILGGAASVVNSGYEGGGVWNRPDADHIARYSPDRVLRDIETDRELIARYEKFRDWPLPSKYQAGVADTYAEVIQLRIQRFTDHPDFQEAWRIW